MTKIDMALYKEIGQIIKRERVNQDISLDRLVEKMGHIKTKSTIKRYEDGISRIDMDILNTICNALNLNYLDVIQEAENKVSYYNNTNLGNYNNNVEYLKDKPELLELYQDIVANDRLVILFDKAKKLEPEELEQVLKIIDTFNKETKG